MVLKMNSEYDFCPSLFTNVQLFVANYNPDEIDYLDIQANSNYNMEELEIFYASNKDKFEQSMRLLIISFFVNYITMEDYEKYNLSKYSSNIGNLIIERGFKKNKDSEKDFIKDIIIESLILPPFQKFMKLDDSEKMNVIKHIDKNIQESDNRTYGSIMFLDHYMYDYFPDGTMICIEALFLLKKGIKVNDMKELFCPNLFSSLEKYLSKDITPESILNILNIYDYIKVNTEIDNNTEDYLEIEKIKLIIKNYIFLYNSMFGEIKYVSTLQKNRYQMNQNIVKKNIGSDIRFMYTSTIVEKTKKYLTDICLLQNGEAKWNYLVSTERNINPETDLVYKEAMMFLLEDGNVGFIIPKPESLPIENKKTVYSICLLILLNNVLYNENSRKKISKLIPNNKRILTKNEIQNQVFRFVGIGSLFVNVIARLYSSEERIVSNDTDCVIVINPYFSEEIYHQIYNVIINIINNVLCPKENDFSNLVDIRTLKSKLLYNKSSVNISFFQNYGYISKKDTDPSTIKRVPLNISLFKVHEFTFKNTILDVSIYLQKNPRAKELWYLFSINPSEFYSVSIPNPITLLIEMYNASKLDKRSEAEGGKGQTRLQKVAFLQRIIPKENIHAFIKELNYKEMYKINKVDLYKTITELYPNINNLFY